MATLLLLMTVLACGSLVPESTQAILTCPKYACSTTPLASGTCISLVNNNYTLGSCAAPTPYCPTNFTGSVSNCTAVPVPPYVTQVAYVGQYCNTTIPCVNSTCTISVCKGKLQGVQCNVNNECDVGLRCHLGICDSVLMTNDAGCQVDEDCELKAGCNLLMGSQLGECVPYFSVNPGGVATDCMNGRSRLCASTYCITESEWLAERSYCINAPQSTSPLPMICTSNSNCTGVSRPWTYQGNCTCGYNSLGKAYCSLFSGDLPMLAALTSFKTLIAQQTFFDCSTVRRFQPDCLRMVNATLYQQYVTQMIYATNYPQLQNNDNCIKAIFTNYYWTKSAQALLVGVVLLLIGA